MADQGLLLERREQGARVDPKAVNDGDGAADVYGQKADASLPPVKTDRLEVKWNWSVEGGELLLK